MEPKEKKAFEPSGLVPRSIVRTFERFRQQLLPGSETAAIREYRISRYQVLVSVRCLFTLLIIPIATNWLVSSWLLSPLVEHFWNTQQNEIFLNSYQEERAFAELESFSEKLFFESLLNTTNIINVDFLPLQVPRSLPPKGVTSLPYVQSSSFANSRAIPRLTSEVIPLGSKEFLLLYPYRGMLVGVRTLSKVWGIGEFATECTLYPSQPVYSPIVANVRLTSEMNIARREGFAEVNRSVRGSTTFLPQYQFHKPQYLPNMYETKKGPLFLYPYQGIPLQGELNVASLVRRGSEATFISPPASYSGQDSYNVSLVRSKGEYSFVSQKEQGLPSWQRSSGNTENKENKEGTCLIFVTPITPYRSDIEHKLLTSSYSLPFQGIGIGVIHTLSSQYQYPERAPLGKAWGNGYIASDSIDYINTLLGKAFAFDSFIVVNGCEMNVACPLYCFFCSFTPNGVYPTGVYTRYNTPEGYPSNAPLVQSFAKDNGSVKALSTYDNSLKIKEKVQNKILELAIYYNQQTIISITNIVGDIVSLVTLGCLFIWMKPEITILKSFLIEAIYSLSDTTKSFLLILLTDLLVGFHSPRGWETALELLLKHFGLPENQDFVFLFVATFPVLLDTVFKYWIFRHLNKISPSTVATYHSMIE